MSDAFHFSHPNPPADISHIKLALPPSPFPPPLSPPPSPLSPLSQALQRAAILRTCGGWLPEGSFLRRRAFFTDKAPPPPPAPRHTHHSRARVK